VSNRFTDLIKARCAYCSRDHQDSLPLLTVCSPFSQVLLRTSYNLTRVVVVDPSGTHTPFNLEDSQVQVHSLQPVTTYRIEVAFLLTGGFMGPSFQTTATTLEAGV